MSRLALVVPFVFAASLVAQTSKIGGSQATNTRVNPDAPTAATTDASGAAHIVIKRAASPNGSSHTAPHTRAGLAPKSPGESLKPLNDTLPTDPQVAVELTPTAFKPYILQRAPCVVDDPRDKIHTRGPVVVNVSLDLTGAVDHVDYIGAPDLGAACMEAIRNWKFAPYKYNGRPWRVTSWIRFEFASPYQHSAPPS